MSNLLLYWTCFLLLVSSSHGLKYKGERLADCEYHDDLGVTLKQSCFSNGTGYSVCDYSWAPPMTFSSVQCEQGFKCRCIKDYEEQQMCACVDPTPRPQFPSTGVIKWTGNDLLDGRAFYDWSPGNKKSSHKKWKVQAHAQVAEVGGEVHLDKNGRYLLKETKVASRGRYWMGLDHVKLTMKTTVVMVIPNADGTFAKYEKEGNNKCKKTTIKDHGGSFSLTSIWNQKSYISYFKLASRSTINDNIEKQEWKMIDDAMGEGTDTWTWIMNYDNQQGRAIPTKYTYEADSGWEQRKIAHDYNYQPLQEGDTSFNVADYCD